MLVKLTPGRPFYVINQSGQSIDRKSVGRPFESNPNREVDRNDDVIQVNLTTLCRMFDDVILSLRNYYISITPELRLIKRDDYF